MSRTLGADSLSNLTASVQGLLSISQTVDISTIWFNSSIYRLFDILHNAGLPMDTNGYLDTRGFCSNPLCSNAKDPGAIGEESELNGRFEIRGTNAS